MKYPKILIINEQSMYNNNATGITLNSLWENWPNEKKFELYFQYDKQYEMKYKNCMCVNKLIPLRHLIELFYRKPKKYNKNNTINDSYSKSVSTKGIKYYLCDMMYLKRNKEVINKIKTFNPDLIYTLGASIGVLKLSTYIAKKLNIPIVIHFMDNWPHFLQSEKYLVQKIYKRKLRRNLMKAYKYCNIGIAISPFMANDYEKETGKKHICLMNSVDVDKLICDEIKSPSPIIFTYAGGLHLERWKPLLEIEKCIKNNIEKYDKDAKLYIYCNRIDDSIATKFDKNITIFKKYVDHSKIKTVYENSSVLIQCENNQSKSFGFFKYSISTKIPEYLSTGRPVLYYAPKDMLLTSYLKNNNLALTASNQEELQNVMDCLFTDYNKVSSKYKMQGITYAREYHSISLERQKLYNALTESLKKWKE